LKQLKGAIETEMDIKLAKNNNSFNLCFQFEEAPIDDKLYRRIKIYNKGVSLFQSASPSMMLGMNTNALFSPQLQMLKALKECQE